MRNDISNNACMQESEKKMKNEITKGNESRERMKGNELKREEKENLKGGRRESEHLG